jgi:hypothetical protein
MPQEQPRWLVSLRCDEMDFIVVFQSEDVIVFRNPDANALWKYVTSFAGRS